MTNSSGTLGFTLAAAALSCGICNDGRAGDRDWSYTYDANGLVQTADGPRSDVADVTSYTYDASGNRTSATNALGHVVLMTNYNSRGQPGSITDANGVETVLTYTPRGWLESSKVKDPGGNAGLDAVTTYQYTAVTGLLRNTLLPDGTSLSYAYDPAERLIIVSNDHGTIRYTYDAAGNRTQKRVYGHNGATGGETVARSLTRTYDELSRLVQLTGAAGQVTTFGYDKNGNQNFTSNGNHNTTARQYDALDQLTTSSAPLGHHVLYQNDNRGNLTQVTDPRTLVTTYTYDGLGNLTQLISPDTGIATYTYDKAGNRLSQTDARGIVSHFTYDALNRVLTRTYPSDLTKNVSYAYDNGPLCPSLCKGRLRQISDSSGLTAYSYDAQGRVVGRLNVVNVPASPPINLTTVFTYNRAGRLSAIEYPNGQIVSFSRDGYGDNVTFAGKVTQVTRKENATAVPKIVANAIDYEPFGPMKGITYGNGLRMNRAYDLDGRLASQTIAGKQDLIYHYDPVNNIAQIGNQVDPSRDESFNYDALDRLRSASGRYGAIGYDYDSVGNRTARTFIRDGKVTEETYTYSPSSNRLDVIDMDRDGSISARNFLYDENGNLIYQARADGSHVKPHYDATNRMDGITPQP